MGAWETTSDALRWPEHRSPPDTNPATLAAINDLSLSVHPKRKMREGNVECSEDVDSTLILCLCRRLRSFTSYCGYEIFGSIVFAVIEEAAAASACGSTVPSRSLSLQEVRSMTLENNDLFMATDFWLLREVFVLPSLESLQCSQLFCEWTVPHDEIQPSIVKRVHFDHGYLNGQWLKVLLEICPQLEDFAIHWVTAEGRKGDQYSSHFDYEGIGDALRQHAPAIKSLTFDLSSVDPKNRFRGERGFLGSLKSLAAMRQLKVPFSSLFGYPVTHDAQHLCDRLPFSVGLLEVSNLVTVKGGSD